MSYISRMSHLEPEEENRLLECIDKQGTIEKRSVFYLTDQPTPSFSFLELTCGCHVLMVKIRLGVDTGIIMDRVSDSGVSDLMKTPFDIADILVHYAMESFLHNPIGSC